MYKSFNEKKKESTKIDFKSNRKIENHRIFFSKWIYIQFSCDSISFIWFVFDSWFVSLQFKREFHWTRTHLRRLASPPAVPTKKNENSSTPHCLLRISRIPNNHKMYLFTLLQFRASCEEWDEMRWLRKDLNEISSGYI